ncbi:MAG: tetratricopeptide repeat-containing sensor histidine kinase [Bacteroidia bacterium]
MLLKDKDTSRINTLYDYALWLENINADSAEKYYELAGRESIKLGYKKGIYKYYSNISYILNVKGLYTEGLRKNKEAINYAEAQKDETMLGNFLFNLGSSYNNLGEYDKALEYYLNAEKIIRKNDRLALITVYNNIGGVFSNSKRNDKALEYYKNAELLAKESNDTIELIKININKGIAYNELGMFPEAVGVLNFAQKLLAGKPDLFQSSICASTLAYSYGKLQNFPKAGSITREAIRSAKKIKSNYALLQAYKTAIELNLLTRQIDSAAYYSSLLDSVVLNDSKIRVELPLIKLQKEVALLKSDYKSALSFEEKYWIAFKEQEELKMEVKMIELENKFILTENENKTLQLQRSEQEKNQFILYLSMALLTIVLLASITLLLINLKRKRIERENILQQSEIRQLKNEQQLLAANAVLKGQEEERLRIAKDLHDGLGGLLSGIKLTLLGIRNDNSEHQKKALLQLDNAINEMRQISHSMVPEALNKFGLVDAINDVCTSLSHSSHTKINFQAIGITERLENTVETNLYRILLELLNNTIKHASATEVFIQIIRQNNTLSVMFEDNGVGFDLNQKTDGIGLKNILWRIKLLNGTADIQSAPQNGVSISIEMEI